MTWILLVRIAIWLTFFLLIAGGIVALIYIPRFVRFYFKEHKKLEVEIKNIKRFIKMPDLPEG